MKLTALHQHRFGVLQLGVPVNAGKPSVLVEAQAASALIETNPQMFPMLGCGKHQRRRLFTSRDRERRPERLRTCSRVMAVVLGHADMLTLSDGQRVDGECKPITELQLGRELGIEDTKLDHDTTGMRAMRSALRDLDDAELVSRAQPKIQYCAAAAGGCGKKIPRGRSCKCGRRQCWRWRSLPTIITVKKSFFAAVGLLEQLEDQQAQRYRDQQLGKVGPEPERNILLERDQRRRMRQQHQRDEGAGLEEHQRDPDWIAASQERIERMYREKKRE
jgi:hypothetical protein